MAGVSLTHKGNQVQNVHRLVQSDTALTNSSMGSPVQFALLLSVETDIAGRAVSSVDGFLLETHDAGAQHDPVRFALHGSNDLAEWEQIGSSSSVVSLMGDFCFLDGRFDTPVQRNRSVALDLRYG